MQEVPVIHTDVNVFAEAKIAPQGPNHNTQVHNYADDAEFCDYQTPLGKHGELHMGPCKRYHYVLWDVTIFTEAW